jgi:hypothetical protein
MVEQPQQTKKAAAHRGRNFILITALALAGLSVLAGGAYSLLKSSTSHQTAYLGSAINKNDLPFPVFLPIDRKYKPTNTSYSNGVLIYQVMADGQTATISEAAVPADLANSLPVSSDSVQTRYGKAAISLLPDRTTAILIANKRTMINASASANFAQDTLKDIMRSLTQQ